MSCIYHFMYKKRQLYECHRDKWYIIYYAFKKIMLFTFDTIHELKKNFVCNLGPNVVILIIHALLVFYLNGS